MVFAHDLLSSEQRAIPHFNGRDRDKGYRLDSPQNITARASDARGTTAVTAPGHMGVTHRIELRRVVEALTEAR